MGLLVPEALGGQGLDVVAMARIMEVLAAADLPFAFSVVVHNNLASNIARNGQAHHHEAYLPDMIAGRRIGAFRIVDRVLNEHAVREATGAPVIPLRREG